MNIAGYEAPTEIADAVEAIKEVYKHKLDSGGGLLHSEIDDGNLESLPDDDDIDSAVCHVTGKRYSPIRRKRYKACVAALEKLTVEGREFACYVAHGHDANEWISEQMKYSGQCPCCDEYDMRELVR
jgi:hypothetical protein